MTLITIIGIVVGIIVFISIIVLLIGLPISCKSGTSSKTGKTGWFGKPCTTCPVNTYSLERSTVCNVCPTGLCSGTGSFDILSCQKCPEPTPGPDPGPDPDPGCLNDLHCKSPKVCKNNICIDYQCDSSNCFTPMICENNACITPGPIPDPPIRVCGEDGNFSNICQEETGEILCTCPSPKSCTAKIVFGEPIHYCL